MCALTSVAPRTLTSGTMKDISAPQRRVLAYNRVAENKRRARTLVAAFALISLPAAAFLAIYLTFFFAVLVGVTLGVFTVGSALGGDAWQAWAVVIVGLAVLLSLLTPVLILWRATYLVLRLSGARALTDDEQPELRRTVENLCIGSGLPQPSLYVIDAGAANAFSTGLSPESSSLVLTTGLLELLERRELEGVVAQELVQIGNYDTRVSTVLAAGTAFLRLPFTVVVTVFRFLFRVHFILSRGSVCLDRFLELQRNNGGFFHPGHYGPDQLLVDMEKPANFLRNLGHCLRFR